MTTRSKTPWVVGVVVGGLLTLAPACGLVGTVVGLMWTFEAVSDLDASRKAEVLASGVDTSMRSTAIGLALLPVGVVILVVSIYKLVGTSRRMDR